MKDVLRMSDGRDEGRPSPINGGERRGSDAKSIDGTVQVEIGVRLKAYYDTITREPVPDRFVELLGELDNIEVPQRPMSRDED